MTVNYTTNLSLGQPVTGTESGTWGDDVNNAVTSYLDIAITGSLALTSASFTANALTLANTQGTSSATNIGATTAQYYVLRLSSLAANVTITAPSLSKTYLVVNADSTYSVTVKASGQTGTSIAAGERATVYYNGTDYIKVTSSVVSNLTGTLPVANGGTGLTTTPANGALDIGNGSGFTRTTLTGTSPVTVTNASGSITLSLASAYGDTLNPYGNKTANTFLASPNGVVGTPSFRSIVAADIPTLNQNTTGTAAGLSATLAVAFGGTGVTSSTGSGNNVLSISPTFTGTPLAPTAATSTNTTQIATTAFVQAVIQTLYPVGSIYTNASDATNPGTLFGFGTWVAFGQGRVNVGAGTGGGATYTAGATGGNKDSTGLPSHTHTATFTGNALPPHYHEWGLTYGFQGNPANLNEPVPGTGQNTTSVSGGTPSGTVTVDAATSGVTNGNLQPYVVVYMWQRTA